MPVQYRDDHVPGWVYLLEAEGYHGLLPGVYLHHCKIGLTRSVENRLDTLHSSQPLCNCKELNESSSGRRCFVMSRQNAKRNVMKVTKKFNSLSVIG